MNVVVDYDGDVSLWCVGILIVFIYWNFLNELIRVFLFLLGSMVFWIGVFNFVWDYGQV